MTDHQPDACTGVDGYTCLHAKLWGPRATDLGDTARRYVMCCTCLCHPSPGAEPVHDYLSTSCHHGRHAYCQADTGAAGTKVPSKCKWCPAMCTCNCHKETT